MDCIRTILTFPTTSRGGVSEYKGVSHCEGYDCGEFPEEIMEAPLSEPLHKNEKA